MLDAVQSLAAAVAARPRGAAPRDASLSAGSAGFAILFAELHRAGVQDGAADLAARELDEAAETLATSPIGASLYPGFTGIAWAAHVVGELLEGDDDASDAIDDAVVRALAVADWQEAPYDLITGLTGLGFYALERWPRPTAREALIQIVGELARTARHDDNGTYWWTPPTLLHPIRRAQYPGGGVDLGVAHGIAGVIPFLARVHRVAAADVDELLEGTVQWLLANVLETEAGPTVPYYIADNVEPGPARLGWCYGDPGVAAALMLAAHAAWRPDWLDQARRLARTATRRPPAETGVVDAGFCHGSAGLAHLFNRMYQYTGDAELREAALFWLDETLERLEDASTPKATERDAHPALNGHGLLEGSTGVALALLAAAVAREPAWDRMFLVSMPG